MTQTVEQLHERIERLEHLLALSVSGAASGVTFAGPIVANEAALIALAAPNGLQVFVLSHRSIWTKRTGVAGTQGVPPLSAHEVLAATDATGVFCRTSYSDPALRVGINDIWIDPANGAANDENDGLTAGAPLQTGYELFRRWGWDSSKPLVGCNLATSPDGFLTVHVQSNVLTPDSLPIKITIAENTYFRVRGGPSTILRTSTLTDAVIAMNPAVPLGGTRLRIRDNTLATWAAFEVANRRVRFTNGPAAGGTLQPQTDIVAAPGGIDCTPCQTTNEPGFSQVPTTVTPAVGNTYVVESLVVVNLGELDIAQERNSVGFDAFFNVVDCNIPASAVANTWGPTSSYAQFGGPNINFYQCTIDRFCDFSNAAVFPIACLFTEGFTYKGTGFAIIEGGGFNAVATTVTPTIILNNAIGIDIAIDSNFVANQLRAFNIIGPVRNFASWNAVAAAAFGNAGGHGVIVGLNGTQIGFRGGALFQGLLWGNTSGGGFQAGAGLLISAACKGAGAPQNITGTQGDLKLAEDLSAIPLYDTPSYVYARVTDAQVVANATDVGLQAATSGNLVIAANTIALVLGKTYRLVFEARGDTTTAAEVLDFAWVDAGTNAELIASTGRGQISGLATNAAESFGIASIIYKPAANQTVKVRCIAAVGAGSTTLRQITGRVRVESLFEFPIVASWANLTATVAAGGFGGGAHNPRQDSSFVAAETTA